MPLKMQAKPDSIEAHYQRLVADGEIQDDAAQRKVLEALAALEKQWHAPRFSLFKKAGAVPRGMYIWGNVGRGKSMLMDLFFEHVPVEKKRRVHFHAFMQEIHVRIHELRKKMQADPVALLARQLAGETTLLCFDELQVADVADATLLFRLFSGLFDGGVTIVSTSNHPPATLYTGGVQRERFAKFIALIEERMQVIALSSPEDYRMKQMKSLQKTYCYPLGAAAIEFIERVIEQLAGTAAPKRDIISVQGRDIAFLRYQEAVGLFTFHQLCETALGPADYLALAKRLDTVIITGIPKLSAEKRNEAKRFVTLIDTLYENKVKLIATADAPPQELYAEGDGAFEFQRTVSRLMEMQGERYLG